MRSLSVSSISRFAWPVSNSLRYVVVLAVAIALLQGSPNLAQSTSVPIQTPQQVLGQPLRSIAEVVRGEQTIRTRSGIGFRKVRVRAQDEIWLVSARDIDQCELSFERLSDGKWLSASMAELIQSHSTDPQKASLIYVHGNRTDDAYARSRGLQFYENMFNGEVCSGPMRFVIFAWQSEREKIGGIADFRIKLDRSVELGPTFAEFLNQFEDRQLILTGFSLGSQIILSALVDLEAREAMDQEQKIGKYRVALITPALQPNDSLNSVASLPSNPVAAETVVFVNRKDSAIQAASIVAKATSQIPAVTLEQIAGKYECGMVNSVTIEDITKNVSRCHSITKYSAHSVRLQAVVNQMANDIRASGHTMLPTCEECDSGSMVEVVERVADVPSSEPALK